jgi:Fe-S-cluster containining protein
MSLPWYSDGLEFSCTECGGCCTGAPGAVWVSEEEVAALAAEKGCTVEGFRSEYIRPVDGKDSLTEVLTEKGYDCVFLEGGKRCTVYSARPTQCRTFPFWPRQLESPEAWQEAALDCEGIGRGDKVSFEEIEKQRIKQANAHPDV